MVHIGHLIYEIVPMGNTDNSDIPTQTVANPHYFCDVRHTDMHSYRGISDIYWTVTKDSLT